ncbi:hypothetical protein M3Y94_01023000 [Aphelenchoides besseyi]|nr:hypothetical protein M3Y94_01023000 [Aphelenchoides besseyi]
MSSSLLFTLFVCAMLIDSTYGSIIGTLMELPQLFSEVPSKETMKVIKGLTAKEKKLVKEAVQKYGGQYKSDDLDVLTYIKDKDETLYKKLDHELEQVNKAIKKIKDTDTFLFINTIRKEFGNVNVKDDAQVTEHLDHWHGHFYRLTKEGQKELQQHLEGVYNTLEGINH